MDAHNVDTEMEVFRTLARVAAVNKKIDNQIKMHHNNKQAHTFIRPSELKINVKKINQFYHIPDFR